MGRKYARETTVPVAKSRQEIDTVLRKWGANQLQWSDDYENGRAMLRFLWKHGDDSFIARFSIQMPTDSQLREECVDGRNGDFSQTKYDKATKRRGMIEHRELALFIKAAFVAVEAGIIPAEHIFLPFIEGGDGMTVAEAIMPRLGVMLQKGSATALLPEAKK